MRTTIFTRKPHLSPAWEKRSGFTGGLEDAADHAAKLLTQDAAQGDADAERSEVLLVEVNEVGDVNAVATRQAYSGQINLRHA